MNRQFILSILKDKGYVYFVAPGNLPGGRRPPPQISSGKNCAEFDENVSRCITAKEPSFSFKKSNVLFVF